jgi:hypothetical protein
MKTRLKIRRLSNRAKFVVYPTVILAALNFAVFVGGSFYLGGDALNGYVRGGHYFVCAHGSCGEVSSAIWHYSYWHAVTALGGILLVFVEMAIFINTGDIEWE